MFSLKIYLGEWWSVSNFKEITGSVAIEFQPHCYVKALNNGQFVLSEPHALGKNISYFAFSCTDLIVLSFYLFVDIKYVLTFLTFFFFRNIVKFISSFP